MFRFAAHEFPGWEFTNFQTCTVVHKICSVCSSSLVIGPETQMINFFSVGVPVHIFLLLPVCFFIIYCNNLVVSAMLF